MIPTVFATFGDGRTGWRRAATRISREAIKSAQFEQVHKFNMAELNQIDPEISNLIVEIRNRAGARGYGYWVWKTAILFWLDKHYPDSQICYVDSGSHIDTSESLRQEWMNLLQLSYEKNGLAWALPGYLESQWTKTEVFQILDSSGRFRDSNQIQSGFICLPPSNKRALFCEEYRDLALTQNGFLFTDEIEVNQTQDFIESRHDQSVLSLLWKKYDFNFQLDKTNPSAFASFPIIALRNNTGLNGKHSKNTLMAARYCDLLIDQLLNRR
jgi:hypothetical protein